MALSVTARTKLYIGGVLPFKTTDYIESDFTTALTNAKAIGFLENLGSFGDEATEITFEAIDFGRTLKLKGTRNAGSIALVAALDESDQGQAALIAAEQTDDNYAFKVEWDDAVVGGDPTTRYFIGMVLTASEQYDTVNNVKRLNATIGINSNIVKVAADPGSP